MLSQTTYIYYFQPLFLDANHENPMKNQSDLQEEKTIGALNIVVIVLSIYVLLALLVDTFFKLPTETSRLLDQVDNAICIFFLLEFLIRFIKAEKKLVFMKWGWIDLISSIPTFNFLRAGRALRLIRLLRILRAFRSTKHLVSHIYRNRPQGAFTTVSVIAILMVIFSAIAILQVETDPNSNIKTAEDALWWAYVIVTTVGYGDRFPVTTEGRIIGALLMTVGVGLFGTFSGFVASWFLSNKEQ
jgi:voltage-gated potassium channel